VVTLRREGKDVEITPLSGRWRVECDGRVVESAYLEYAIAEAIDVDEEHAVSTVTRLIADYLATNDQ
jgi:hypothetical protein